MISIPATLGTPLHSGNRTLVWLVFCFLLVTVFPIGMIYRLTFICLIAFCAFNFSYLRKKWVAPSDQIHKTLIVVIAYCIIDYIIHYQDARTMMVNIYRQTGIHDDEVYFHVVSNGILAIISYSVFYLLGRYFADLAKGSRSIFKLFFGICSFIAVTNIINWAFSTHGAIGRYNYKSFLMDFGDISLYCTFAFWIAWATLKTKIRWVAWILFVINLTISGVRKYMGLLVLQILIATFFYIRANSGNRKAVLFVGVPCGLAVGALVLAPGLTSSFAVAAADPNNLDFITRTITIASAISLFLQNPLTGISYGAFGARNTGAIPYGAGNFQLGSPHNGAVAILCEFGILGTLAVLWLVYLIVRNSSQILYNWRDFRKTELALALILLGQVILAPLSNFTLIPPPSEFAYMGTAAFLWFSAGYLAQKLQTNTLRASSK